MPPCVGSVIRGTGQQALNLLGTQCTFDRCRAAHNQTAVGEVFAFRYQRACRHQAVFSDARTVENDGPDANQRAIPDGAAMLRVEDDGIGIDPESAPKGTGLGSRIVKSMAATLGDGLHYLEGTNGTVAEVPLKLDGAG